MAGAARTLATAVVIGGSLVGSALALPTAAAGAPRGNQRAQLVYTHRTVGPSRGPITGVANARTSAPVVTKDPAGIDVKSGKRAVFKAAASGKPKPSVQWELSTDNGTTFAAISGATARTYAFIAAPAESGDQYEAVFTNSTGTATTTAAVLGVDGPPTVSSGPATVTVAAATMASFSATATGVPAPTVQWEASTGGGPFTPVSGATSDTYAFTASTSESGNQYEAVFTNVYGTATSAAATLTVDTVPAVTTEPADASVLAGATATFTAAATGVPAPTVQWDVSTDDGATFSPVSGATAATYSFTTSTSQSGNWYEAVFTNPVGTATTDAATLAVNAAPVVTAEPADTTVMAGDTATFTAAASGSPSPTVQWDVSTNDGATFTPVSGATAATYSFTANSDQTGDQFEAVFTNSTATATTTPATLTVTSAPPVDTPPSVTTEPSSQTVDAGGPATFTAEASGYPTPTVQWEVSTDGGDTFSVIGGATATTYSFSATAGENGDQYEAVFTNSTATATTTPATLTVDTPPTVTTDPSGQTVDAGGTATFTAAASGTPTPTVQWEVSTNHGGTYSAIAGATATTYSFSATAAENGNQYEAVFTNSDGNATTTSATLTVDTSPTITTDPTGQTVGSEGTATFTAAASGTPTPTVQWEVSTNGGDTFSAIGGATATTYSFTATSAQNGDQYEAIFTNSVGSATTTAATLTVENTPTVTTDPTGQTVASGATATFSAAATGTPTPTVQWEVSTNGGDTFSDVGGATTSTYSFSATTAESGYRYRAVFTNSAGTATTTAAVLVVTTAPASGSSTNWSGYADDGTGFDAVTADWTAPTVTCSGSATTYSSAWIGIDGDTSQTVEQDGTEADCIGGTPSYDAWYELYGDNSENDGYEIELSTSTYPVSPGDAMSASVTYTGGNWTFVLGDTSRTHANWTYTSSPIAFSAAQSSAEWIVERPEICGSSCSLSNLADFGSTTFTAATASTGLLTAAPIDAFAGTSIDMTNSRGTHNLAVPGSLGSTGTSFTDTWEESS